MKKQLLVLEAISIVVIAGSIIIWQVSRHTNPVIKKVAEVTKAHTYSLNPDIPYCSPGGNVQKLDLYTPSNRSADAPVIVHVHGGSWTGGKKSDSDMVPYLAALTNADFIVASINYRLAPASPFPAQIQDVKCAIRFLRANAAKYHINPAHIGIFGESAGGHLAALAGTAQEVTAFETNEYAGVSDKADAVVDLFGPTDLVTYVQTEPIVVAGIKTFLGSYSPQLASPTHYVSPTSAPMLIMHGDSDILVPYSQSQQLYDALSGAGIPTTLVKVANAGHGFTLAQGSEITPSIEDLQLQTQQFFKKYLQM